MIRFTSVLVYCCIFVYFKKDDDFVNMGAYCPPPEPPEMFCEPPECCGPDPSELLDIEEEPKTATPITKHLRHRGFNGFYTAGGETIYLESYRVTEEPFTGLCDWIRQDTARRRGTSKDPQRAA